MSASGRLPTCSVGNLAIFAFRLVNVRDRPEGDSRAVKENPTYAGLCTSEIGQEQSFNVVYNR
jgi:hypothetical protein